VDSKYIGRSPDIAARSLGGEMMIVSVTDSTLFCLNEVATVLWQAADCKTPLSELVVQTVCQQFEVGPEMAVRDAREFAEELSRHAILFLSDEPISSAPAGMAAATVGTKSSGKKLYIKPSFRYERVFETMALSCGKVNSNQFQCRSSKKTS